MQELFEALENFKPRDIQTHYYVVVRGRDIECLAVEGGENHRPVSKEDYLLLLNEGHQNYYFENGNISRKPKIMNKRSYNTLQRSDHGLKFLDSDPYWPKETEQGGYTWQAPSE